MMATHSVRRDRGTGGDGPRLFGRFPHPRPIGPGSEVEASLPVRVAGNTQAPTMAVAWIAADLIREGS